MSPQLSEFGGPGKTGRSYTDAFGKPLCEPLHDTVLRTARGETDRVRDRRAAARAVGDHDEPAQSEQVGAAVGLGVEPRPEAARGRPDQRPAELPGHRRADLGPERVEELDDRPLEQLQRDVAGEA